jgi:hypothetical protein
MSTVDAAGGIAAGGENEILEKRCTGKAQLR